MDNLLHFCRALLVIHPEQGEMYFETADVPDAREPTSLERTAMRRAFVSALARARIYGFELHDLYEVP